ncbi:3-oxoacyl-[acyl-carrier-protein] synthase III [Geoalkalibacter ferrihydriticus]|uniref:Beta-ketoacyl-[acyl-carrier-protein] synthase III n=2 Tax=Geoalkalibacter ferrihydriticus TaxID=392333 RepID=A0A0C2DVB7_9BACT|nr:beta-ketoacyl-ACP synthase III [Geoalkalibacter ferrihydriticus]KIH77379.1 3-oxoacyl-ACP synthase [Geoalkalibacter ferrihydriticus DSM 17813]SDM17418.1 3-oxoacyl-[acyl-carrier-protein] synthase III [Geoalkalibacter ferrihydriticus]
MKKARIVGTGCYAPEAVLTNRDIEKKVDTNDEWIVSRTGIRERRIAAEGECTSDLAAHAARRAMEMAGVSAQEIDLIVVGTITGDFPWPATACLVQEKIGAKRAFAFDVSAACSGFVYALDAAVKQIQCGGVKKALVIGAEILSRIVDWEDRNTCVLFGDGAGAVVLSAEEGEHGVLSTHLHSDGSYWELLYQAGFGARHPASSQGLDQRLPFLKMQGNEVFKVAVRMLTEVAHEALTHNGMECKDIDLFIPHQANRRILEAVAKRLHLRDEQVYINVDFYGNTSGASIPIALDEANRAGRIKPGDILLFDAFGGGFTWASALIRW